ncbi:Transcription initiation factor TFIID subunit 5 [Desmophyllum pertusum]|uniref:Transcription initiation factor TFIID subunit 5 n=1 Tax=Desmophyllum pertusum TaxID=174260 RepID=A0A9W9Z0H8_9CNID|nr:Transcription initiation factor TFIID subunit 5 [Desmophyllum pertusum]
MSYLVSRSQFQHGSTTAAATTSKSNPSKKEKETLIAVLQYLKKKKLPETEKIFRQEVNCFEAIEEIKLQTTPDSEPDISSVLSAYNSDADPTRYEDYYSSIQAFVEKSLDIYKPELAMVLYPMFVHMYLELVYKGSEKKVLCFNFLLYYFTAQSFFACFRGSQEDYHEEDLSKLSAITRREHMKSNELMGTLRSNKFVIRMSKDTYQVLKKHLQFFEGRPRNKQTIESTAGAVTGEATFEANKSKVYYGIPPEPDLGVVIEEENEDDDDKDKPKKKKVKKDSNGPGKKETRIQPKCSTVSRQTPFPDLKDSDKLFKISLMREAAKRLTLGPDILPSICFYSVLNAHASLNSVSISNDSSLLSGGFEDSSVRVWSLTPKKLRMLKSPSELAQIDKEAEDVLERIMDHRTAVECRRLIGHSGPVFSTSFNNDNSFLLSSSADKTVRLWSLYTFSSLVSFKGHNYPVWDVQFCPRGHYFATASHDRTARLWSTDHPQPLRIFAGHVSDVNRVAFHPNCYYVATGSCDRTVRLWDINTGSSVRFFTGHKGAIYSLAFSPDGRFLASSGVDKRILVWDIAEGTLLTELKGHSDTVYSLSFSKDGNLLASGGVDNCVKLWNARSICNPDDEDDEGDGNLTSLKSDTFELGSYPTKRTPVHCLHFTLRNLLLASGPFTTTS